MTHNGFIQLQWQKNKDMYNEMVITNMALIGIACNALEPYHHKFLSTNFLGMPDTMTNRGNEQEVARPCLIFIYNNFCKTILIFAVKNCNLSMLTVTYQLWGIILSCYHLHSPPPSTIPSRKHEHEVRLCMIPIFTFVFCSRYIFCFSSSFIPTMTSHLQHNLVPPWLPPHSNNNSKKGDPSRRWDHDCFPFSIMFLQELTYSVSTEEFTSYTPTVMFQLHHMPTTMSNIECTNHLLTFFDLQIMNYRLSVASSSQ